MKLDEIVDSCAIEDLSDIDLDSIMAEDDDLQPAAEEEIIDPFSGKFDLSYYGISPNVILKENPEIIKLIISLTINSAATRKKINSLLNDMNIFRQHMEYRFEDVINHPDIPFDTASQVLTDFTRNLNAIENHAANYNYDMSDTDGKDFDTGLNISNAISYLTATSNVQDYIKMIVGVDSADTNPKLCAAINIAKKYEAFIYSLDQLQDIRDRYLSIRDDKNALANASRGALIIADALAYSSRNYAYTNDELIVMEYYDFPYLYCGMEKYFKSSPRTILDKLISSSDSRTKAAEKYREVEAKKTELVHKYHIYFTRKKIMCEDNAANNVNTNCIYF